MSDHESLPLTDVTSKAGIATSVRERTADHGSEHSPGCPCASHSSSDSGPSCLR